jgi:hypothetical protein
LRHWKANTSWCAGKPARTSCGVLHGYSRMGLFSSPVTAPPMWPILVGEFDRGNGEIALREQNGGPRLQVVPVRVIDDGQAKDCAVRQGHGFHHALVRRFAHEAGERREPAVHDELHGGNFEVVSLQAAVQVIALAALLAKWLSEGSAQCGKSEYFSGMEFCGFPPSPQRQQSFPLPCILPGRLQGSHFELPQLVQNCINIDFEISAVVIPKQVSTWKTTVSPSGTELFPVATISSRITLLPLLRLFGVLP